MDLITHGLLGSTVAQAAYSSRFGKKAALYGLLIGLAPDFDIISGYWGQWASLKYHRGPTHSFILLFILAFPVGMLCRKLARSETGRSHWAGLTLLCLVTHSLIDLMTSYGTCLAWPLSDNRFAADALPIIEPVYSLPLFVVTILGLFSKVSLPRMKTLAIAALAATSIYAIVGLHTSKTLVEHGSKLFKAQGFAPVEVRALPTLLNLVVFRVVGRDANNRFMITYLKQSSEQPLTSTITLESDHDEYVNKALNHANGTLFKLFAMNMLQTKSIALDNGEHKVVLNDMRYGLFLNPEQCLFAAEAYFDKNGLLTRFIRIQNARSVSMKKEVAATLAQIFSGNCDNINAAIGGQ